MGETMKQVNTGGGAYISGNINTSGDFVGRDSSDGKSTIDENGNLLSSAFAGGVLNALGQRWRLKQPVEKRNGMFVYVKVQE